MFHGNRGCAAGKKRPSWTHIPRVPFSGWDGIDQEYLLRSHWRRGGSFFGFTSLIKGKRK